MTLQSGDTIPLTVKLWDGDTTKFVKAVVVDSDNITLGTITLTHVSEGFYQDTSLSMPNKEYVTAYYIVYDDVGLTIRSASHQDTSDLFALDPTPLEIIKKVQDIIVTVEPNPLAQNNVTVDVIPETIIDVEVAQEIEVSSTQAGAETLSVEPEQEIDIKVGDC